jgi:hypothetical protein
MDETPKPLPVLTLEYAPPSLMGRRRVLRITGWLSIATLVIGTIACIIEVESVIASGPAISVIGLIMVIYGLSRRPKALWVPGLAHLLISGLFVGLVNGLNWSPRRAQVPFSVMSVIYTIGMTIALLVLMADERRRMN